MPKGRETILRRIADGLRFRLEDIAGEPLPRRWIDLIHHLDEQERTQPKPSKAGGRSTEAS
jgi:hypothetical protein